MCDLSPDSAEYIKTNIENGVYDWDEKCEMFDCLRDHVGDVYPPNMSETMKFVEGDEISPENLNDLHYAITEKMEWIGCSPDAPEIDADDIKIGLDNVNELDDILEIKKLVDEKVKQLQKEKIKKMKNEFNVGDKVDIYDTSKNIFYGTGTLTKMMIKKCSVMVDGGGFCKCPITMLRKIE